MDNEEILQSIKEDLEKEGLDCIIQPSDALLQTNLLIYTGLDKEKKNTAH